METVAAILAAILGFAVILLLAAIFAGIGAAVVYFAWGWIAVDVFHLPALSFWQIFIGLWALRIVFGAFSRSKDK